MEKIDAELLKAVADMHSVPQGVYNIRKNGESIARNCDEEIRIVPKTDKSGIDIFVKEGVKNRSLHIPVIITQSGLSDLVYNDFHIGKGADVVIVAGCGIHNVGDRLSQHDGIHSFHLEAGAKVKYIEKHLGMGSDKAEKVLNPTTVVNMSEGSSMEMETTQLGGVTYSKRKTKATLGKSAKLVITEKILTTDTQTADTIFDVVLKGKNSSVEVVSRSVAKDKSVQKFVSNIKGKAECFGHIECDGILLGQAKIVSTPSIVAENVDASLVHEASIGKIAGEQLVKLQTLGLTEEEAQNEIIKGFLK